MAKWALQLSCLDHENLRLKLDQWKHSDPESNHYFLPYYVIKQNGYNDKKLPPDSAEKESSNGGYETRPLVNEKSNQNDRSILWIHQSH